MRLIQNVFTHKMLIIELDAKSLQNTKSYAVILLSVILTGFFSLSLVDSMLTNQAIVRNTGRISSTKTSTVSNSEIRGVFGYEDIYGYAHDWNVIAQTLKQYGINAFFMNDLNTFARRPDSEISAAIAAFHANGIEYHSLMAVLCDAANEETAAVSYDGTVPNIWWQCPIKAHDYVIAQIADYFGNFSADGLMLDFIRYGESTSICYCPYCRAAFEAWLGEGPITDWTPFYPDESRWSEYAEWRTIPVTTLVRDIYNYMHMNYPDVRISEAAWAISTDSPIYWRKYLGQDTARWIKEGWLDFVAPMMYTTDLPDLQDRMTAELTYWTAGPEGKIPLLAFFDMSRGATPAEIKANIDLARSMGLDGWILWRYGGPGTELPPESFPDVRDYLSIIDMPHTFSLRDIKNSVARTQATIAWTTDYPTTGKVEYNRSQLFTATWQQWKGDMYYWWTIHVEGIIVENSTPTTDHSITLTSLLPGTEYYFRVQSQDASGTATSQVLTFTSAS